MALGLQMSADANRDLPPVYSQPFWPESRPWRFDFGPVGEGYWFEHAWLYSYAVTATLGNIGVAVAAGNTDPYPAVLHRANTLFAEPEFFRWETQSGPAQFGAQRLARIAFPSDKGLLWPPRLFHHGGALGCCQADLPTPIAFADHSVSTHVMKNLRPGIANLYAGERFVHNLDPRTVRTGFVSNTEGGILGRDR